MRSTRGAAIPRAEERRLRGRFVADPGGRDEGRRLEPDHRPGESRFRAEGRLSLSLTPGEMRMASLLFGDAIDCARARTAAMAPNGSIYSHPSCFLSDHAAGDPHTIH